MPTTSGSSRPRVELHYPGHPGGPLGDAIEVAIEESQFELDAAKIEVKFDAVDAASADDAKAQLAKLEKDGAAAVVLDLPAAGSLPRQRRR